jgi:hypothetical protein
VKSASSLLGVVVLCLAAIAHPSFSLGASEQTGTDFPAGTQFVLPDANSTITFATSGHYGKASLNQGVWDFSNLAFGTTEITLGLPSTVNFGIGDLGFSATDCNITVLCLEKILGFLPTDQNWLNYTLVGSGSQALKICSSNAGGMVTFWNVYIDGENRSKGNGWTATEGDWLNITGAKTSVCIHRHDVDPVTVKVWELKTQGLNDTQIIAELRKLHMGWNPETGATAIGDSSTPEEKAYLANPSTAPMHQASPLPLSTERLEISSQENSSAASGLILLIFIILAIIVALLIATATVFHLRYNREQNQKRGSG